MHPKLTHLPGSVAGALICGTSGAPCGSRRGREPRLRGRGRRALLVVIAGAAALGLVACGGEEAVTEATTLLMEPSLTVSPAPITAVASLDPSTDPAYTWTARYTATVVESGGVGGTITSVQATLNEASGGIEVVTSGEEVKTLVVASGDRIDPLGTTTITFTTDYTLPGGGREAVIDVYVGVTSDDGGSGTLSERVSVN